MPAIARLAGKRVRSSECLLNSETVSKAYGSLRLSPSPACGGGPSADTLIDLLYNSLPCLRGRVGVGAQGARNYLKTSIGLLQHVIVPEPQHFESTAFQKPRPRLVPGALFVVLATIDFNDQACINAGEIGDERPDRILSSELVSIQLPPTQAMPKSMLGVGHLFAQRSGIALCALVTHAPILTFPRKQGKELKRVEAQRFSLCSSREGVSGAVTHAPS